MRAHPSIKRENLKFKQFYESLIKRPLSLLDKLEQLIKCTNKIKQHILCNLFIYIWKIWGNMILKQHSYKNF